MSLGATNKSEITKKKKAEKKKDVLYNESIVEQFIDGPMKKLMETQRFTR